MRLASAVVFLAFVGQAFADNSWRIEVNNKADAKKKDVGVGAGGAVSAACVV